MPIFARILDEKYIKTFFMINPIVKRTHIYINFSDEKECIFFARTSVDRVERLR
jgi:hypothetical protein